MKTIHFLTLEAQEQKHIKQKYLNLQYHCPQKLKKKYQKLNKQNNQKVLRIRP
mgnify:CR=1 FL=1